jgi:hypothetical protein
MRKDKNISFSKIPKMMKNLNSSISSSRKYLKRPKDTKRTSTVVEIRAVVPQEQVNVKKMGIVLGSKKKLNLDRLVKQLLSK